MNWTLILAKSGTPEPPGRAEAVEALRAKQEGRNIRTAEVKAEKQAQKNKRAARAGMNLRARKKYI